LRRDAKYLAAALTALLLARAAWCAPLEIAVRPTFEGEPLRLDSLRYTNSAKETLSVSRLSYLLSGFALQREDGTWVEVPGAYAWMDAAQQRNETRIDAPPGKYRAVRFYIGLDDAANVGDPTKLPAEDPLNANLNNLRWTWQGGYVFLALEGHYRVGTGPLDGFVYHLARAPNRTCISLTAELDLGQPEALLLDFDLGALLNAPHPLSFAHDGTSTHSRVGDPVATALVSNLPGAFHVVRVVSYAPAITLPSAIKPLYLPAKYTPYPFTISSSFPIPDLPRDNPLIVERVTLGEKLFHETALSRDNTISCASCHQPEDDFTDPRRFSLGVRGQVGIRHAMPLFNLAWKTSFFWDGRAPSLRAQVMTPIQDHREMDETLADVTAKLAAKPDYAPLFTAAFGAPEITAEKLGLALEAYLLTLTSFDAKFDRAMRGQATLTPMEQQGAVLFMTEYDPRTGQYGADCFHCHGGPLFTDHQFHNNGLELADDDTGRFAITHNEADRGKFATPSLRNVARTGPYMHDGRFTTLEEVVAHYNSGIHRSDTLDPNIAKHPVTGMHLSAEDQKALVAFLGTLTDERFAGKQGR
jgi:cytochrome c peroxidase